MMNRRGFLRSLAQATAGIAFLGVSRLSLADGPGWEADDESYYGFVPTENYAILNPNWRASLEIGRYEGVRFAPTE